MIPSIGIPGVSIPSHKMTGSNSSLRSDPSEKSFIISHELSLRVSARCSFPYRFSSILLRRVWTVPLFRTWDSIHGNDFHILSPQDSQTKWTPSLRPCICFKWLFPWSMAASGTSQCEFSLSFLGKYIACISRVKHVQISIHLPVPPHSYEHAQTHLLFECFCVRILVTGVTRNTCSKREE